MLIFTKHFNCNPSIYMRKDLLYLTLWLNQNSHRTNKNIWPVLHRFYKTCMYHIFHTHWAKSSGYCHCFLTVCGSWESTRDSGFRCSFFVRQYVCNNTQTIHSWKIKPLFDLSACLCALPPSPEAKLDLCEVHSSLFLYTHAVLEVWSAFKCLLIGGRGGIFWQIHWKSVMW